MVLKVDLQCCRCYKKVKKVLAKFPQIREQMYDEKANTVTITVVCCSPEKIRDKLCCKGGGSIKCIEIVPPPPPPPPPPPLPPPPPSPPPPLPPPPPPPRDRLCCTYCYHLHCWGPCYCCGPPPPPWHATYCRLVCVSWGYEHCCGSQGCSIV